MHPTRSLRQLSAQASLLSAFSLALLLAAPAAHAADEDEITAVAANISGDYVRVKRADGGFETETYAFGKGGYSKGGMTDKSIDETSFMQVARVIAGPLQQQNYVPSKAPGTTKLLIMVYWGTTNPPPHLNGSIEFNNAAQAFSNLQTSIAIAAQGGLNPAAVLPPTASSSIRRATGQIHGDADMEDIAWAALAGIQAQNRIRRQQDIVNSRILGYDSWWASTAHFEGTPLDVRRQDMITELEEERYYVVLMAYDFPLMWKQKKAKLLWETRFSIRQRHHQFDRDLAAMALHASKYFGQDTHGLIRKPLLSGTVNLGELQNVGVEKENK